MDSKDSSDKDESEQNEDNKKTENSNNVNVPVPVEVESNNNEASTSETTFPKLKNFKRRSYRTRSFSDDSSQSSSSDNEEPENNSENPVRHSDLDNSNSTLTGDTASEEETCTQAKEKPKHNWFMVPEVINRQIGCSLNKQTSDLFQKRCYSSLHCVKRLTLCRSLKSHRGCVNCLNFHHNGSILASGSDDLKIILWDFNTSKPLLKFDSKHRSNVFQSKFLPLSGDLHIATCARDGQVRLSQVSVQEGVRSNRKVGQHSEACHKLAVIKNQPQVFLSAGEDGVVFSHDVRDSKPIKVLKLVSSRLERIALYSINAHPLNGYEFCICGRDKKIRTYDQRKMGPNCTPLATYYASNPSKNEKINSMDTMHVTCAVYNHNGSEILASYNDGDIFLFDVDGTPGTYVHRYRGHRNADTIKGVNFFGPKSEYIVSGSDCGNVFIWEKNTESIVNFKSGDVNGVVNCLEPHPQLPYLCTSGLDWDIKVWMPLLEEDVQMVGLESQIKVNTSVVDSDLGEIREGQLLWMLWRRHLNNIDANNAFDASNFELLGNSSRRNSSSDSSHENFASDDSDNSDNFQGPNCVTS